MKKAIGATIGAWLALTCAAMAQQFGAPMASDDGSSCLFAKPMVPCGVPSWVKSGANADMDFANGRYFGCTIASCLTITRASNKTNLLPTSSSGFAYTTFGNNIPAIDSNGLLIEESRTNQLLNSTVPATQTTGTLANGAYTLWVNGSGTATMSTGTATGCGTGVASQGTPVNFTTSGTAGTCTVTVSGSLNFFQLELGAFGTSGIVTAGATAARAADNIQSAGALQTIATSGVGSLVAITGAGTAITTETEVIGTTATIIPIGVNSTLHGFIYNGSVSLATSNTADLSSLAKLGSSFSQSGRSVVLNNGTVATDGNAANVQGKTFQFGATNNSNFLNRYLQRVTAYNVRLADATLKAQTQ